MIEKKKQNQQWNKGIVKRSFFVITATDKWKNEKKSDQKNEKKFTRTMINAQM